MRGKIRGWSPVLDELAGTLLGAFDGRSLVGFAIYEPCLTPDMGQLAVVHGTRSHRRNGLGALLTREVVALATRTAQSTCSYDDPNDSRLNAIANSDRLITLRDGRVQRDAPANLQPSVNA